MSRVLLILVLVLLHSVGSELVARFYATPYVSGLVAQQQTNDSARFAFGPPPGQGGPGGSGARGGRSGGAAGAAASSGAVARAIGVVVQSALFIIISLIIWWLLIIFIQFLGGEEEKTPSGPHRNSKYLITYAWFPFALRRLFEGLLINLQDPSAAWSAVNLAQYRRESAVSFSLLSLVHWPSPPAALAYLVYNLTDPFYLWFLFVIVYGGRAVFRLSMRSALVQGGFVMVMLYLLQAIFSAIGVQTGV